MYTELNRRLNALVRASDLGELLSVRRGLEKESLRICSDGQLSQTPHPPALGSALTNPRITTDFSEALLEFITPPGNRIEDALGDLDEIHRFSYAHLDDELLWACSMPCILEDDDHIPVARYGSSNVARMKTIYRVGLGHRYGRLMQTIAGIHYNFSLSEAFWSWWRALNSRRISSQDSQTSGYFSLIRNFHRNAWLLIYLFGASPALCRSFIGERKHQLSPLTRGTLHSPYGTSLRMGDLGYQSTAQDGLDISYNSLEEYVGTLERATREPHADYQQIGLQQAGDYKQLSTSLLQIENEYYSSIRPKRVTRSGEAPRRALSSRGVEYVEVRCIDLDPYLPTGIGIESAAFIETFLIFCLLMDSPWSDASGRDASRENLRRIVKRGREPGLMLLDSNRDSRPMCGWAKEILQAMSPIAEMLDQARGGHDSVRSLARQMAKIDDSELTPSARILAELVQTDQPFYHFAMQLAKEHQLNFLSRPLPQERFKFYSQLCTESLNQQQAIEQADEIVFEKYLARYYDQ